VRLLVRLLGQGRRRRRRSLRETAPLFKVNRANGQVDDDVSEYGSRRDCPGTAEKVSLRFLSIGRSDNVATTILPKL
jgi:hypothetical protein